ncbi:MAG: hypothetical protein DRJ40_10515 [Thermoprotei archaeon]|nr:MAG: hypothetical protein DRJ40_10515 [Thermoprotei archaeon]
MVRVIPVLDVMGGLVVHAVAGRREEYRPISGSVVSPSPDPRHVLSRLYSMGFREIYIADLDAIVGRGRNDWVLELATSMGFKVLADVGRRGLELQDKASIEYVIGTEYLEYPSELDLISGRVMSLDCFDFDIRFRNTTLNLRNVLPEVVHRAPKKILLIDLSKVGTMQGPNTDLVKFVRSSYSGELIVGGGTRDESDVLLLKSIGVDAVLVATALHRGIIKRVEY